jgi:carboxypeptidase C (cathepsin A)
MPLSKLPRAPQVDKRIHSTSMWVTTALFAAAVAAQATIVHAQSSNSSSSSAGSGLNGWYSCSEYTFSDEGSSPTDAECAVYTAPLCYTGVCDDSTDATVDIFVKRILASSDSDSKPNVWFFQGGPGASSTASTFISVSELNCCSGLVRADRCHRYVW